MVTLTHTAFYIFQLHEIALNFFLIYEHYMWTLYDRRDRFWEMNDDHKHRTEYGREYILLSNE